MATILITPPTIEPVSLEEAKDHLRVSDACEDGLIVGLIQAAREYVERFTSRQLITATWAQKLDAFPACRLYNHYTKVPESDLIRLPKPPLQSVSSITYVDTAGVTQTLDPAKYIVDTTEEPARLAPAFGQSWPSTRQQLNAVTITFIAGYGLDSLVPSGIRTAMKLLMSNWFENREATISGTIIDEVPMGVSALLWPYRVIWEGGY